MQTELEQTTIECPSWCHRPAGHPYADDKPERAARMHVRAVATWESGRRRVSVEIAAPAEAIRDTADAECLGDPLIGLRVEPDDGVEDLTAEQARDLASFLSDALRRAADQL